MLEPAQWPEFEKEEAESLEFRKTVRAEYEVYHLVAKVLMECIAKGFGFSLFYQFEMIISELKP